MRQIPEWPGMIGEAGNDEQYMDEAEGGGSSTGVLEE